MVMSFSTCAAPKWRKYARATKPPMLCATSTTRSAPVAAAGVRQLSTIAFGVPLFDVFNHDNVPTFRDGKKWPDDILDGDGRGQEAGYKAVNARTLWDNGVVYGYGTDTGYLPVKGLAQELKALNLMFSMTDIVKLMGPNTAAFVQQGNDIGTLEPGRLADIVVFPANPLDGYWNMLNAAIVIKGGEIVVDEEEQALLRLQRGDLGDDRVDRPVARGALEKGRSEEHTSELQSP